MYGFKSKLLYSHETFRWNEYSGCFRIFYPRNVPGGTKKWVLDAIKFFMDFVSYACMKRSDGTSIPDFSVFYTHEMFLSEQKSGC